MAIGKLFFLFKSCFTPLSKPSLLIFLFIWRFLVWLNWKILLILRFRLLDCYLIVITILLWRVICWRDIGIVLGTLWFGRSWRVLLRWRIEDITIHITYRLEFHFIIWILFQVKILVDVVFNVLRVWWLLYVLVINNTVAGYRMATKRS